MYLSETKSEMFVDLLIAEVERLRCKVMEVESGYDTVAAETNPAPKNPYRPRGSALSNLLNVTDDERRMTEETFEPRRGQ